MQSAEIHECIKEQPLIDDELYGWNPGEKKQINKKLKKQTKIKKQSWEEQTHSGPRDIHVEQRMVDACEKADDGE